MLRMTIKSFGFSIVVRTAQNLQALTNRILNKMLLNLIKCYRTVKHRLRCISPKAMEHKIKALIATLIIA